MGELYHFYTNFTVQKACFIMHAVMLVLGLGTQLFDLGLATQVLGLGLGRRLEKIFTHYINTINSLSVDSDTKLAVICSQMKFVFFEYLFERIVAILASLAPVKWVFSKSGLSSAHVVRKCRPKCSSHYCLRSVPSSTDCCDHEQCAWLILAFFFVNCQFVSNNNNISIYS